MLSATVAAKTAASTAATTMTPAKLHDRLGSSPASTPSARPSLLWIAVLALAAALPYLPTLNYGFVYDDAPQIVHNPDLLSLRSIPRFFTESISKASGFHNARQPVFYRPLFFVQLCLTRILLGPGPFGFHLVSLLFHIANTLLLFFVARRLGLPQPSATLAGLLFAVHPVHVECVVWPSASPDLIVLCATLTALFAVLKSQELTKSTGARSAWRGLSLLALLAGLFVKETALISLPLLAAIYLLDPSPAPTRSALRRLPVNLAPYLAVTLFYLIVRSHVLHGLAPTVTPTAFLDMARTWPSVLWFYERHLILPIHSSLLYDYDLVEHATFQAFWFPLAALLATSAIAALFFWRRRSPAVLAALLLLVPPILLVLNFRVFYWRDLVHDRYLYTSSAGFSILAALALVEAGRRCSRVISPSVQQFLCAGMLCALALTTVAEAQPWRNNLSLLAHAAQLAPRNIGAQILLGDELEARHNFVEARISYLRAVQLTPDWGPAWFAYGRLLLLTGEPEGAMQALQRAIALGETPIADVWLASAMDKAGRHAEARALRSRAIAQDPAMLQASIDVEREVPPPQTIADAQTSTKAESGP